MAAETLPKSIIDALPSALEAAKLLNELSKLLPKLEREIKKAAKDGATPMARAFVALHRLDAKLEDFDKQFGKFFQKTKTEDVPRVLDTEGVDFVPLAEGFRVGTSSQLYVSIKKDFKLEAWNWLKRNDLGDLITETINASTLSAAARKLREDKNIDLPEEFFTVVDLNNTSVTVTKK